MRELKTNENRKVEKLKRKVISKFKQFKQCWTTLSLAAFLIVTDFTQYIYAADADANAADAKFNSIVDFIVTWVAKGGGLLIFLGVVEYGYGHFSDRPEDKTKGTKMATAGCIIAAAAFSANTFLF